MEENQALRDTANSSWTASKQTLCVRLTAVHDHVTQRDAERASQQQVGQQRSNVHNAHTASIARRGKQATDGPTNHRLATCLRPTDHAAGNCSSLNRQHQPAFPTNIRPSRPSVPSVEGHLPTPTRPPLFTNGKSKQFYAPRCIK